MFWPLDLKATSFQLSAARSRCASLHTPCGRGLPGPGNRVQNQPILGQFEG